MEIQKFLRRPDVERLTGLPRSTIYELMSRTPPAFPSPARLSPRIVGWIEAEVIAWQRKKIEERDAQVKRGGGA